MLSLNIKRAFYVTAGPAMRLNAAIFRLFRAPRKASSLKVHLGPGQKKYMQGWLNVDANMFTGKCDLWADLRNPLPFHNATIGCFYSHHMIEHLPSMEAHIRDVFRCLKPGGMYRIGGPNADAAIQKFTANDLSWFGSWPDDRRSIGGRFENFIFCRGEHLTILTYSFLEELLQDAGFVNIKASVPSRTTNNPTLFQDCLAMEEESDFDFPHTLIIEAEKPLSA